jgi:hypothetical protein
VTDSDGADDPPPRVPRAILEAKPGASEAEFFRDVDRMLGLAARHGAVMDRFAELRAATGPLDLKKTLLVIALVDFFMPVAQPADLALVLALFPPSRLRLYGDILRGRIAAAVAGLVTAGMETVQIERWLKEEIQRRALDFEAGDVIRWFYDCSSGKVPVRGVCWKRSACPPRRPR